MLFACNRTISLSLSLSLYQCSSVCVCLWVSDALLLFPLDFMLYLSLCLSYSCMIDTDKNTKREKYGRFFLFLHLYFCFLSLSLFVLFVYNKRTSIRTNRELFSLFIFNEKKKTILLDQWNKQTHTHTDTIMKFFVLLHRSDDIDVFLTSKKYSSEDQWMEEKKWHCHVVVLIDFADVIEVSNSCKRQRNELSRKEEYSIDFQRNHFNWLS